MKITRFLWKRQFIEKLELKHHVSRAEAEEIFRNEPCLTFVAKGIVKGQNLYRALGRTEAGRYLTVLFIQKSVGLALVISARDMSRRERKRYAKK